MAKNTTNQKKVSNKVEDKIEEVTPSVNVVEHKITFAEYTYRLDNTLSRVLKSFANVNSDLVEKTKSEWDKLLHTAKNRPIL